MVLTPSMFHTLWQCRSWLLLPLHPIPACKRRSQRHPQPWRCRRAPIRACLPRRPRGPLAPLCPRPLLSSTTPASRTTLRSTGVPVSLCTWLSASQSPRVRQMERGEGGGACPLSRLPACYGHVGHALIRAISMHSMRPWPHTTLLHALTHVAGAHRLMRIALIGPSWSYNIWNACEHRTHGRPWACSYPPIHMSMAVMNIG